VDADGGATRPRRKQSVLDPQSPCPGAARLDHAPVQ
jgi:hypothetical protein